MNRTKIWTGIVILALAFAWAGWSAASRRHAAADKETALLKIESAELGSLLAESRAAQDALRKEAALFETRLAEAGQAGAREAVKDRDQLNVQNEKLRGEIARLSEENVRHDTQTESLRTQLQETRDARGKLETEHRNLQAAHAAVSNEAVQLRASDADKTVRLTARDQELAAKNAELAAAAKNLLDATTQLKTAAATIESLKTQADAARAETAAAKTKLAELEAELNRIKPPAAASAEASKPK